MFSQAASDHETPLLLLLLLNFLSLVELELLEH